MTSLPSIHSNGTAYHFASSGADSLHLVIFDRRPEYRAKAWEERLCREEQTTLNGKTVSVVWC